MELLEAVKTGKSVHQRRSVCVIHFCSCVVTGKGGNGPNCTVEAVGLCDYALQLCN